jgi:hypothetical protein
VIGNSIDIPRQDNDARWWLKDHKEDRHKRIVDVVRFIRYRQTHWRKRDLLHAHLYGNLPILGFGPNSYSRIEPDDGRLIVSLVKSKVDTYQSLICRGKPKPMFLTSRGTKGAANAWSLKKRAKGLERWAEAKLYECDFYEHVMPLAVLDSALFDHGWGQVNIVGVHGDDWSEADIEIERGPHWEYVIDDAEAMNGMKYVRNAHRRHWMDRFVAAEMWPSRRGEIMECPKQFEEDEWGYDDTSDQILVTESWHLPSGPDAKDGLRVLSIITGTLQEEPYELDSFPFDPLTVTKPAWGIRGIPLAAQLRPLQVFINQMYLDFQDAVQLMARPKWLNPRQGGVPHGHFDDDISSIIDYTAPFKPEAYAPGVIPADAFQLAEDIWKKADEIIGISSYTSGGIVPSNLKSGRAQEVALDTRDGRFLMSTREVERWTLSLVDKAIDAARIIAKHRPDYASRYTKKTYVEVVHFKEVDMKRDEYVMKCYPASALANTPGARYDQLQDMFDRGLVDLDTFRYLLDFPDLEGETKLLNAPKDLAERLAERFLDADDPSDPSVYLAPEPNWPLQQLYLRFIFTITDAENDGAPDENIELLRRFNSQIEFEAKRIGLQLPGMPAPGQGPANTAAPLGQPGGAPPPMAPGGAAAPPAPGPPMAPPMPAAA